MPRFDQTGPMGLGPGSGRGRGMCANKENVSKWAFYSMNRPRRCFSWYNNDFLNDKDFLLMQKEMLTKRLAIIEEALAKEVK